MGSPLKRSAGCSAIVR
jgi:Phage integrase family.